MQYCDERITQKLYEAMKKDEIENHIFSFHLYFFFKAYICYYHHFYMIML